MSFDQYQVSSAGLEQSDAIHTPYTTFYSDLWSQDSTMGNQSLGDIRSKPPTSSTATKKQREPASQSNTTSTTLSRTGGRITTLTHTLVSTLVSQSVAHTYK